MKLIHLFSHFLASRLVAVLLLLATAGHAQSLYFPPNTGSQWDTLSATQLGWCTAEIPGLYTYLENSNTKAFLVLKDGKIVLEKYFGQFTSDSSWYWASAGKCLTAVLVGIAQAEGLLHINDTVSTYLGNEWTSAPANKEQMIRVRDQLSMTTGLSDLVPQSACTDDTCLLYLADAGTRWAYHNAPYTLLDGVLRAATAVSPNIYIQQKLRPTTGFTGLYLPNGFNQVFFSTPRMMARFGLLCLSDGKWGNNIVLSDTTFLDQMKQPSQALNPSYGYLWWLNGQPSFRLPLTQLSFTGPLFPNAPMDMYSALGKDGQIINLVPSEQLVVIRMGNAPGTGFVPVSYNDTIWQLLNEVICAVTSSAPEIASRPAVVYPNPFQDYLRLKALPAKAIVRVRNAQGQLVMQCEAAEQISTAHLIAGMYMLEIESEGRLQCMKLLKR